MLQDRWKREVLSRLDSLAHKAKQCRQYLEANDLSRLDDNDDFLQSWQRIRDLFPKGFVPDRASDLNRHTRFAMPHDFEDIEMHDIPAVRREVEGYGHQPSVPERLDALAVDASIGDAVYPLIKDDCIDHLRERRYAMAAQAGIAVVMRELRRLSGSQADGDHLIREVVGVQPKMVAFSDCTTNNAKSITDGLKMIAQGLYKGVRNPIAHGRTDVEKLEAIQVMVACSLLVARLQIVEA